MTLNGRNSVGVVVLAPGGAEPSPVFTGRSVNLFLRPPVYL